MRRLLTTAAIACLALTAGCIEGELDRKSIINRWRVLAIQADRPEVQPGMDVRFDALVVTPEGERAVHGEEGVRFDWVVCLRMEETPGLSGLQYSPEDPSEACGAVDVITLSTEDDGSATLDGATVEALWPDADMLSEEAEEVFGGRISPELIRELLSTVGVIVTSELTVREGGEEIMRAYKRITVVEREELGTNPPEPRFQVDDRWISARDVDEPWTCLPEDGEMPVVDAGEQVVISPDPDDESWRETYFVLDITGTITEGTERPYYSFFSTDGTFDQEVTRAPVREEIWVAPEDAGLYPLWVVVRDGHGGMTACRTQVEVR